MAQAAGSKVSPTVSVYLGDDLATRVAQAKEAGLFEPKDVCKQALEQALAGQVDRPLPELVTRNAELEGVVGYFQEVWAEIEQVLDLSQVAITPKSAERVLGAIRELQAHPLTVANAVEGVGLIASFGRGPDTDFKLSWSDDEEQLLNRLRILDENNAWPVSVSVVPDGRILMLAAWPTE